MKRGDLVTVSLSGDYGKPRPALIIQDDAFDLHPSVTVLPLTSQLHDAPLFRVTVDPGKSTGLKKRSQVMVDKTITVPRERLGETIGRLDHAALEAISDALRVFLGL
ncbi:MAG TPA: type II toxin-antitoxin system PemK/MazF family toxin [Acidobacteriaceae bacterium]|nr:type II toxin-antitoxin system PemK/MazF family toxin [Acidobacteriaceae bacterium]